jgi:hypothetical protein
MRRNDKEYVGVHEYIPVALKENQMVAAIWFDGEPDFYICDGEEGLASLVQLYKDDWDGPPEVPDGSTFEGHVSHIHVLKESSLTTIARTPDSPVREWGKTE